MVMDTSPADDNDRRFDYADASNPDEDWTPVFDRPSGKPWFQPYTPGSAIEESGGED